MQLELDISDWLSRQIYYYGTHEPSTTTFLQRRWQDPKLRVVYDVGSNIGFYAIMAAVILRHRGIVEGFEPVPKVFNRLQSNLSLNALPNLRIHPLAVAESAGTMQLYVSDGLDDISSVSKKHVERASSCKGTPRVLTVPKNSLDTLLEQKGAQPPNLIRMDIELGEQLALQGMTQTLKNYSPDIVVEVLPEAAEKLEEIFEKLNYKTYWIDPDGWLQPREMTHIPSGFNWYATRGSAAAYMHK